MREDDISVGRKAIVGTPIGHRLCRPIGQLHDLRSANGLDDFTGAAQNHHALHYIQVRCSFKPYFNAGWPGGGGILILPAMPETDREPVSVLEVAARLQLTREALKLSQAALCRLAGISPQTWNNAETGDNRISVDEAIKLCRVTGVTLDWIYRGNRTLLPSIVAEEIARRESLGARRRA